MNTASGVHQATAVETVSASTSTMDRGPFKGLDFFVEEEENKFFGRHREVGEIVARITAGRTLVLYGRSGMGKTSLVRAGIIPELRRRGYETLYLRLLGTPLDELRQEVRAAGQKTEETPLINLLTQAAEGAPLVVVLDQFEELFTRFEAADRTPLIEQITRLLRDESTDIRFLFSIREEFIAELDAFDVGVQTLLDARYRLRGLTGFSAREIIAQPLIEANIEFSQKLLTRLVTIAEQDRFDPLLIQIVCTELCQYALQTHPQRREIDEKDLEQLGDPKAIFERHLQRAEDKVPNLPLDLRMVLDGLLTSRRTKRPTTVQGLLGGDFVIDPQNVQTILGVFESEHIVRKERRGVEDWYELVHDRLAEEVLRWCERDRRFRELRFARELIRSMAQGGLWRENVGMYLSPDHIALVGQHEKRLRLGEDERNLMYVSAVRVDHQEAAYWSQKKTLGDIETERFLERLLGSTDSFARRGAARAVAELSPQVPYPGHENRILVEKCLRIAMDDPEQGVRSTAAASFVKLATSADIVHLKRHLEASAASEQAFELLAAAIAEPRIFDQLDAPLRRRALQIRKEKLWERNAKFIEARAAQGKAWANWSALGWLVIAGLLLMLVLPPAKWGTGFLVFAFLLLVPLLPFAHWLGGWVAMGLAREEVLKGEKASWLRALLTVRVILWIAGFTVFWLAITALVIVDNNHATGVTALLWLFGLPLLGTGATFVMVAMAVRLGYHVIQPAQSSVSTFGWALAACVGTPILGAAGFGFLASLFDPSQASVTGLLVAAVFGSLATITTVFVFGMERARQPAAPSTTDHSAWVRRARVLLVLLALGSCILGILFKKYN